MIEKFTEDMFNLHYFQFTESVHCMNCSKSYTEDGKGNMDTQTFCTITEKTYLSDKVLSHLIRKFHKPTLRGDL